MANQINKDEDKKKKKNQRTKTTLSHEVGGA
jgi:hypothetical protein